jgi:hypothetical protein
VTLATIDVCLSGRTNAFNTLLCPYYDGSGNFVKDQAVLTWNGKALVSSTQNAVWWYFPRLLQMDTIETARSHMLAYHWRSGRPVFMLIGDGPLFWWVDKPEDMPIYGDHCARIKGVYTGSHFRAQNGWYRQIL